MLGPQDLRIPRHWKIYAAGDTGTFMGGLICAISPIYDCYCLEEFPNYHYTGGGTPELLGITVREWMKLFGKRIQHYTKERRNRVIFDYNTTFKTEMGYGIVPRLNKKKLELRTEITREYMRHGRIILMPWLKVLPFELQEASFPEETTAGGRYERIKRKDHVLDCLEHICSVRPHPDFAESSEKKMTGKQRMHAQFARPDPFGGSIDPHLGSY